MRNFRYYLQKGVLLGVTAGLLATLFDSLYMVIPREYAPASYPFLLLLVNVPIWLTFGMASSFIVKHTMTTGSFFASRENIAWLLSFLLPFGFLFGILGRLYYPFNSWGPDSIPSPYDSHLSFVWIAAIVLFLLIYAVKRSDSKRCSEQLFFVEMATFIGIYHFCSNLSQIKFIVRVCKSLRIRNIINLEEGSILVLLYTLGILGILLTYLFLFFSKARWGHKKFASLPATTIVLFFLTTAVLAGCFSINYMRHHYIPLSSHTSEISASPVEKPNVILIVLDTVRADRLSMYADTGLSENLEALAKDSLVFDSCVASSSWTLPSHASLFTGLYPVEHGVHGDLNNPKKNLMGFPVNPPLFEQFTTLAEIFSNHGYQTASVVSNILLSRDNGFGQGFQYLDLSWNIGHVYQKYPFRPILHLLCRLTNIYPKYTLYYRTADDITKRNIKLIERLEPDPFFLFINYMDAHEPYNPPRPFLKKTSKQKHPHLYNLKLFADRYLNKKIDDIEWNAQTLSLYDGEIAFIDYQLGKLFRYLKNKNIYDSSLIIVTSDHGELFGEHNNVSHRGPMYEGAVKVPLLIKYPFSKTKGRESTQIGLPNLFYKILSASSLPVPASLAQRQESKSSQPVIGELYNIYLGVHRVIYDSNFKYMSYQHLKDNELYDIANDPREEHNLAKERPLQAKEFDRILKSWQMKYKPLYLKSWNEKEEISQDYIDKLKALGYMK